MTVSSKKEMKFGLIVLLLLAVTILFSHLPGWGMTAVKAEETESPYTSLGIKGIQNPQPESWDIVYFGKFDANNYKPMRFRVLTTATTNYSTNNPGKKTMLLDCDGDLGIYHPQKQFDYDDITFGDEHDTVLTNSWRDCYLRRHLNRTFYDRCFTDAEKSAIYPSTTSGCGGSSLDNDNIFILDTAEIRNGSYGYTSNIARLKYPILNPIADPKTYWLRSGAGYDQAYCVDELGDVTTATVKLSNALFYPALNIDLDSILLSTKIPNKNEYTLTVKDNGKVITSGAVSAKKNGDKTLMTIQYSLTGDHAGNATQISVLMTDKKYTESDAKVMFYGKMDTGGKPSGSTSGTIEWPENYNSSWCVYILAEDVPGEKQTNSSSLPALVPMKHVHKYTYSLSEDKKTITATCREPLCGLPESKAQLTISAPAHSVFLDRKDANAAIEDQNGIKGSAKVKYFKIDSDGNKVGDDLGKAPEDPGNYRAEITLGSGDNEVTAYVEYSVDKQENGYIRVEDSANVIVGENTVKLAPFVKGHPMGTVTYAIDQDMTDGQCQVDANSGVFTSGQKTGECTVKATDSGDEYTKAGTVTITVKVGAKGSYPLPVTQKDAIYGEELEDPTYREQSDWKGDPVFTYSGTIWDGTTYEETGEKPTEVGKYTINVSREAQIVICKGSDDFEILTREVTDPVIEVNPSSFVYDGKAKEPEVVVKDVDRVIPSTEYDLQYSNNINKGTATVTVTDKDGGNYIVNGTANFTITQSKNDSKEDNPDNGSESITKGTQMAKASVNSNKSVIIGWSRVKNADCYQIFIAKCNSSSTQYNFKLIKTIKKNSVTKCTLKGLKKGQNYKFRVKARKKVNGKYRTIKISMTGHFVGGNESRKYTNPKAVKLNTKRIVLKKGRTARIKGEVIPVVPGKAIVHKADYLRFSSSNPKVARVNSKGLVRAIKPGKCVVYAQAINGIWKSVKVIVQ